MSLTPEQIAEGVGLPDDAVYYKGFISSRELWAAKHHVALLSTAQEAHRLREALREAQQFLSVIPGPRARALCAAVNAALTEADK